MKPQFNRTFVGSRSDRWNEGKPPPSELPYAPLQFESELLSNVVFVRRESGGVLQDSVGEDSSLDDERELMACVEASPATCR